MKGDFSRHTFDPDRPYSSVRMQQGRVLVDADWNEQGDIQEHLRREALRDIIGKSGVPESQPDSFQVFDDAGTIAVRPGRIWIDGMLCEEDDVTIDPSELPPAGSDGTWLVYLEARERHLTAIEDPSIREVALGGPDTCTRTRTTCRVRLQEVDANSCEAVGDFVPDGNTDGSMAAGTVQPTDTTDPCVVPSQAGYAGLENQLYRVEIHRSGSTAGPGPRPTFKWSRHNGSVLSAWTGRSGRELSLESLGRDTERGFYGAQWVELGDDELDAAEQSGPLVEVEAVSPSEHGEGGTLTIIAGDEPQLYDPDPQKHPKVRRWDSGAIEIDTSDWQDLELHVRVRFTPGTYRAGDYWWIPARAFVGEFSGSIEWPETGGVPDSIPPHGVARSIAKLGLVHLDDAGMHIDDCRCVFPTLCHHSESGCCCTVTVGPHAEYRTIQEGIDALADTAGGRVCVQDGIYRENIGLDRGDITIHGCGPRTVWESADPSRPLLTVTGPGAQNISVQHLTFRAPDSMAVFVDPGSPVADFTLEHLTFEGRHRIAVSAPRVSGLRIVDCHLRYAAADITDPDFLRLPALFVGGKDLRVEGNTIHTADVRLPDPDDQIPPVPGGAAGGIMITGGSAGVVLRENLIVGGSWNGITLGSVSYFDQIGSIETAGWLHLDGDLQGEGVEEVRDHYRARRFLGPSQAPIVDTGSEIFLDRWVTDGDNGTLISDGDLQDVRIEGNTVQGMGGCALSAVHFFEPDGTFPDLIGIDGLVVRDNRFQDCLRLQPWTDALRRYPEQPFAAVCLAGAGGRQRSPRIGEHESGEHEPGQPSVDNRFENNVIEGNALSWWTQPVCGLFVQYGRGLTVRGNRLVENGNALGNLQAEQGRRGGVVLGLVTVDTYVVDPTDDELVVRQDGIPALVFHDNVVVAHQGRALDALAFGPVSITDNQLTARGTVRVVGGLDPQSEDNLGLDQLGNMPVTERASAPVRDFLDQLGGEVVRVLNLGVSNELYLQSLGFSGLGRAAELLDPETAGAELEAAFVNGNILFHDNQILLDTLAPKRTFAMSSILLLTLGHLSMQGNVADADLPLGSVMLSDAITLGLSHQAQNNRLTKGLFSGVLSAITLGLMNTTVDNQATHCILGLGAPQISRVAPNQALVNLFIQRFCGWTEGLQRLMGFGDDGGATPDPDRSAKSPKSADPNSTVFTSGGSSPNPRLNQLRKQLQAEGPRLPAATDRVHLRGHDYVVDTWASVENRAALDAVALGTPEAAERFLDQRERGRDLRALGRDRELTVIGTDKPQVAITGRVIGKRSEVLPKNLRVTLSDRKGPQNALAEADVEKDGLYSLSVDLETFSDYFKGNKYMVVSAVYGKDVLAGEERNLGKLNRPVRRVHLRI